jgi:hypothetical protein
VKHGSKTGIGERRKKLAFRHSVGVAESYCVTRRISVAQNH